MTGHEPSGDSHHVTQTTDGRDAVIGLSARCYQSLVTAATSTASGEGLWMVTPPTPGSSISLDGGVVSAEYFVISPSLHLTVIGPNHAWSTMPITIYRGVYL